MNDGTNEVNRLVTCSRRNLLLVNRKVSIYCDTTREYGKCKL